MILDNGLLNIEGVPAEFCNVLLCFNTFKKTWRFKKNALSNLDGSAQPNRNREMLK